MVFRLLFQILCYLISILAKSQGDCLQCFCFGISNQCSSTELYKANIDVTIQGVIALNNFESSGRSFPGTYQISMANCI